MQPGGRLSPTRMQEFGCVLCGVTVLFICGFIMIMIALLHFIFLVCEQLKEAEENDLSSGEVGRGLRSPPPSNQHLKSERSFSPSILRKET